MFTSGFVVVILAIALVATSCSSDPMASDAYLDLAAERDQLVVERDQLKIDLSSGIVSLEDAIANQAAAEAEAATVKTAAAEATKHQRAAERSMATAMDDLESAFDLTVVAASDWLSCYDPDAVDDLPEDVATLRHDLAAAARWFESPAGYDICESRRAYLAVDNAIVRQNNEAMTGAWDTWWESEVGSEDEAMAAYEFEMWRILITLRAIDNARSLVGDFVPEGLQDGTDA